VQALAGPARLLASCYAVVLSRGIRHRLRRDVVLQVRGAPGRWQVAADLAARFDGEAVVAGGLLTAAEGTGAVLPDEALAWARSVRPSARAARALAFAEAGEEEAGGPTHAARCSRSGRGTGRCSSPAPACTGWAARFGDRSIAEISRSRELCNTPLR
jgi:hypothetical protein